MFAIELDGRTRRDRDELLAALAVTASWATWDGLRTYNALTPAAARRVLTRALMALLTDPSG